MADENSSIDYSQPFDWLSKGSEISDFVVVDVLPLKEISGIAYVLSHKPSKARVMWLACADNNKSCTIGFKTPPKDSTGVFHILEHSVLCGSDSYPVKEPFVELIKSSMATFINAFTYPDKTVYPVSSTSEVALNQLSDIYLDAVLHPAIYNKKAIFEQEGWHLELDDAHEKLSYNGVVYNEMKGVFSDPEAHLDSYAFAQLFPDMAYKYESGGDPLVIPDLTYEGFLDHHSRHYQLPNSYTIFYGNVNFAHQLERLGKAFSNAKDYQGEPNVLGEQKPVSSYLEASCNGEPEKSCATLTYALKPQSTAEENLAATILFTALFGSNEAPLKKKLLSLNLGADVSYSYINGMLYPILSFVVKSAKKHVANTLRDELITSAKRMVKRGIDKDVLESAVASTEFALREGDFGSSAGVTFSSICLSTWLYDDNNPVGALRYEDALTCIKSKMNDGYFERLLEELIINNEHYSMIDLVCEPQGDQNAREIKLQESLSSLSAEEKDEIVANVAELRTIQETPDSPEQLATLPRLTVEDIEDVPLEPVYQDVKAALPCVHHELDTHEIDYLFADFNLKHLDINDMPYVAILLKLLGKLETEHYSAEQIVLELQKQFGRSSFTTNTVENYHDPSKLQVLATAHIATLSSNVTEMVRLLPEVLLTTKFDDMDRIKNILTQQKVALEDSFVSNGHMWSTKRAATYFKQSAIVADRLGGVDYYRFLSDLLENFEMRFEALSSTLTHLQKKMFTRDNVELSFTGSLDDLELFLDKAEYLKLPKLADYQKNLIVPEPHVRNEAMLIPGNVSYNALAVKLPHNDDHSLSGAWTILSRALSFDYLWNEVRVKGGAYGVGFLPAAELLSFWTYRDPQIDDTFARFRATSDWLKSWNPTQDELTGYIVSSVATHDTPRKPADIARAQDIARFADSPLNRREEIRNQLIHCTPEDLAKAAQLLDEYKDHSAVCIFGTKNMIEQAREDVIQLELIAK